MPGGNTKRGKSGYWGVGWTESSKKWRVQIKVGSKNKYIGVFEHLEDAVKAYDEEAKLLGKRNLNGSTEELKGRKEIRRRVKGIKAQQMEQTPLLPRGKL